MKKLIFILLFSAATQAQSIQFSAGIDVRNAIEGSKPTNFNPEADVTFNLGYLGKNNLEFAIGYETFKAINFNRYIAQTSYHVTLFKNTKIIPAINYSLIKRNQTYYAPGANIGLRYQIHKNAAIEYNLETLYRTDLNEMYGGKNIRYSGVLKLILMTN